MDDLDLMDMSDDMVYGGYGYGYDYGYLSDTD